MGDQESDVTSVLQPMTSLSRGRHHSGATSHAQNKHSENTKSHRIVQQTVPFQQQSMAHFSYKVATRIRETIFDSPNWQNGSAFGIWVMLWTILGAYSIQTLFLNSFKTGYFSNAEILKMMLKDIHVVAAADLIMYLSMYVTFFSQVLIAKGHLQWKNYGWFLQHAWQIVFMTVVVVFVQYTDLTWIARIFLVLHCLSMVMQQYSYATYNAYLYEMNKDLESCILLQKNSSNSSGDGPDITELTNRINFYTQELGMQSKNIRYPDNITLSNFFMFTMFPTLIYQLEYPRAESIRWGYLFSKIFSFFGVLFFLILHLEQYVYPIVMKLVEIRQFPDPARTVDFNEVFLELMLPLFIAFLLLFYLIWDAILNSIAELTRFGDRDFYKDWWNSKDLDHFARCWNVPVHKFLLRHVYYSSISNLKFSKFQAKVLTFCISAIFHEVAMYAIFRRIRGYMPFFQMIQLPSALIFDSKFMKENPIFARIYFWACIYMAPSLVTVLYLMF